MSLSVLSIALRRCWSASPPARWPSARSRPDAERRDASVAVRSLDQRLDVITAEMNRTFAQALQQATQALTGTIGTVRDEARAVREETRAAIQQQSLQVAQTLGDLKATNSRILEQSRSLDEFQRMLQSPKLRGDFGEFTLEQMLQGSAAGRALRMPGADRQRPGGRAHTHAVRVAVHRLQVSARQFPPRAAGDRAGGAGRGDEAVLFATSRRESRKLPTDTCRRRRRSTWRSCSSLPRTSITK